MSEFKRFCYLFALFIAITMSFTACDDDDSFVARPDDQEESSSSVKKQESSSSTKSSSSEQEAESSSSEVHVAACETFESGTMEDERDGQVYKTVDICGQVWMAENLNYNYRHGTAESYCYSNKEENCTKYGRLYLWSAVMDSAGIFSTDGIGCGYEAEECAPNYPVRGVCPEGWHVPSMDEVETLLKAVGGYHEEGEYWTWMGVARKLKSATKDWGVECMGDDTYGFAALPAGYRSHGWTFTSIGREANFATSTMDKSMDDHMFGLIFYDNDEKVYIYDSFMKESRSVRCIKN